jgi:xylulokinase
MSEKTIIGVDIGTQGTKVALFSESGKCLATAFRKSKLSQSGDGKVEEDPEFQVDTVCQAIKSCMALNDPRAVAAIALSGQMAGILGVNRDGRAVTPYDSWLDTRCAPYIARMNQSAGGEIVVKTGGPVSFNHGPKILWWMGQRREIFRSIKAFVQPAGYAAMRLCGLVAKEAFIDKTYLHFSGFADNPKGCWDASLCRQFHVEMDLLPRIVNPWEIVGELTSSMARRSRLRAGIPVIAGCGDTAASFLASGATREGICVDVAGTASVFAATTKVFCPDEQDRILSCGQAATPGLWHPYAYINGGGMNLEWFRECLGSPEPRSSSRKGFGDFDHQAALLPPHELPLFLPHLGGRVSPSWPHLRGAWAGLTWAHTASHLWRSMLEAVALEYGIYKRTLLRLYPDLRLTEIRVVGGGGKSELWNQIKADVLASRVIQINRTEGAPLGAALLAAYGIGLVKDLDKTARQWISVNRVFRPSRRLHAHYQKRLNRYEDLLKILNAWSER